MSPRQLQPDEHPPVAATSHQKLVTAKPNSHVVGLLLLYSASYAARSIHLFVKTLNAVSPTSTLVIILNQPLIIKNPDHPDFHIISGKNHLREFSGWDAGIQYCQQRNLLPQHGITIFANDTFCHHNKFGPYSRYLFIKAFKNLLRRNNELLMTGEVQSDSDDFKIFSLGFSSWVSTYLFGMTMPLLHKVSSVIPATDLAQCFRAFNLDKNFFTEDVSESLRKKLSRWLFGVGGNAKWHGAQKLSDENYPEMVGKAKSILCEMHLSALSISVGATLIPVFKSAIVRQIRRLERLL